jgi:hypothetical protein
MVLTLETPGNIWRNRGVASLPRAKAWIDVFSEFAPPITKLKLSTFGQVTGDVRFLEDQDGSTAWESIGYTNSISAPPSMLRPDGSDRYTLDVAETFQLFKDRVVLSSEFDALRDGYHFVDIPLLGAQPIALPRVRRIKQFLVDFDDPKRLLELEDSDALDNESSGELDVKVQVIGAGSKSEFLPEVSNGNSLLVYPAKLPPPLPF